MLNGTLDDFALADVFRLISVAAKTGRLDVTRQAGAGKVFFAKGEVYYAESSIAREPVGQKLVRSGALTEGQLRRALDDHAATGRRLGQILLSSGTVSPEELEEAVRGQTEDAVFDLLRWERGEFAWQPGDEIEVEVTISVSVENLIMEASRRLDEFDVIHRKIPSPEVLLAMAAKPPEGAVEINITPDEWRTLVLVNGSRSVADIAQTVGLDEFTAMRTLYGLVSAGLVEVVSNSAGGGDVDRHAISWGSGTEEPIASEPPAVEVGDPRASQDEGPEATIEMEEEGIQPEPDLAPEPVARGTAEASAPDVEVAPVAVTAPDVDAASREDAAEATSDAVVLEEPVAGYSVAEPPPPAWFRDPEVEEATPVEEESGPSSEEEGFPEAEAEPPGPPPEAPAAPGPGAEPAGEDAAEEPPSGTAEELPRLDRTAVVRELAGLFTEGEQPSGGASRSQAPGATEPDERKRVEDDDQVTKGLISRLIDGVKGL